VDSITAIVTTI
jgi:predicted tellurium resistance membrane protein TerC